MGDPGDYWTIERGTGFVKMPRYPDRPFVSVLTGTRACHLHYWTDDPAMDAQGYGVADLVCHGCAVATRVLCPPYSAADAATAPLRVLRDAFAQAHRACVHLGNDFLCPPGYTVTATIDQRPNTTASATPTTPKED